ncbi:MAG: IPT/TIG domain-containing protein [Sulfuricaulis sp.]
MTAAGRVIALVFIVGLSACQGSGGNAQSSTTTTLNNIAFNVASPDMPTPASQTFSATVSAGTILVTIQHNGPAIASTSYTLSGTTAQIVVNPAAPSSLGAGNFTSVISVTGYACGNPACSQLAPGNSQIVHVTYQIPPIVRFVAPYVGVAGTPGSVIIRGQGFEQFTVQKVMFGTTAATSFTVISDTEIQASYPAFTLPVGTVSEPLPVTILAPTSPGTITSLANLVVITPPSYIAATLPSYPSASPVVKDLVYDAERQALLVAVDTSGGEILRYAYSNGSWSETPTIPTAISNLMDIALSTDGQHLLALSQTALYQLNPDGTFTTDPPTSAPAFAIPGTVFKSLAVGNDGYAVVTTGYTTPITGTSPWLYYACNPLDNPVSSPCLPAFIQPATASANAMDNATAVGSSDGSQIEIMQGDSTQTTAPEIFQYLASSDTFGALAILLNQNSVAPAINVYTQPDTTASTTRIVLSGNIANNPSATYVFDGSYNNLGALPSTTLAVVVSPNSNSAYTFDSSGQVFAFNLTAAPVGGVFTPGTPTTPPANPGSGVRMAISPDGGTLFLAGSSQIVVMPAPTPPASP